MTVFRAGNHVEVALAHDPELAAFDRGVRRMRPRADDAERVYVSVKRAGQYLVGWNRPRGDGPIDAWLGTEAAYHCFVGRWRDMLDGVDRYVPSVHGSDDG